VIGVKTRHDEPEITLVRQESLAEEEVMK
jgi:hypothetical protein